MLERVTLIGNLGADPEMRYTPDGTAVANIRVATTESIPKNLPGGQERPCPQGWKESYNGKNWEHTIWWRVACWRQLAENVNAYLVKGRQVFVEGRMNGVTNDGVTEPRVFEDLAGNHRAAFEVTATMVRFLGQPSGGTVGGDPEGLPLDPPGPSPVSDWEEG